MRIIAFVLISFFLSGCASNIVVRNCREVQVEGDSTKRWLCDKGWSDYWR